MVQLRTKKVALRIFLPTCFLIANLLSLRIHGQETSETQVSGNFQSDLQYYRPDSRIPNLVVPNERVLFNGFGNILMSRKHLHVGIRYESYLNAIQGFDPRYKGSGIPYKFIQFKKDQLDVTLGNFYEQFGSGLIFRTFEERGLGFDNAMEGLRVKFAPAAGIQLKGIIGKQRFFFSQGPGIVRGFDVNLQLNEIWGNRIDWGDYRIEVGGGLVSKFQTDDNSTYILPENVSATSVRMGISNSNTTLFAEYAYKVNDPSSLNQFIYKPGESLLVNAQWTRGSLGFNGTFKYLDNMGFHSDRTETGNNLSINFIQPIAKQHTYLLLAFYPYATQNRGETGVQGDLFYRFKKNTPLGGKYGTDLALNYSQVNETDRVQTNAFEGYRAKFGRFGKTLYYRDINLEVSKKVNKKLKLGGTLAQIEYNQAVIEGRLEKNTLRNTIAIFDINYQLSSRNALHMELQNMSVENNDDRGSWAAALVELSVAPRWFFSLIDQYNYGNQDKNQRLHYLLGGITYVKETNRLSVSYGRQREGILCVGGVCRIVPAINGLTMTLTSSF